MDAPLLKLEAVIGFNGDVRSGLHVHPKNQHIIYPIGCTVVIESISSKNQEFLQGHTNDVSCLTVSSSGRFIASGEVTHTDLKADIIIWNFEAREEYARLVLYKAKIQDLAFSPNEFYLTSLGGQNNDSVIVWDVKKKNAICGTSTLLRSAEMKCLAYSKLDDNKFVTGGNNILIVWKLLKEDRKIIATDINTSQIKRVITCIQTADNFEEPAFFCGTTTGDIMKINMKTESFESIGPEKDQFNYGVQTVTVLKSGELLVGAGDGEVALVQLKDNQNNPGNVCFEKKRSWRHITTKQRSTVTSISLSKDEDQFYVGTAGSNMYRFNIAGFNADISALLNPNQGAELLRGCPTHGVKDVTFPKSSDLIATAQYQEIRIWDIKNKAELRRRVVPNIACNSIAMTSDGKMIISAWADGKIRAYDFDDKNKDKTGFVEKFVQEEAHSKGVNTIATMTNGEKIVSGGGEGEVRIWRIVGGFDDEGKAIHTLEPVKTMTGHKGSVSDIKINYNDKECVSVSTDGTWILWDLVNRVRKRIVHSKTQFQAVCYGEVNDSKIITGGINGKLEYWDASNGRHNRELEGCKSGPINTIVMSSTKKYIVTGSDDKLLKIWDYEKGKLLFVGIGHSASIQKAKFCQQDKSIISVGSDGAILMWKPPLSL